MSGSGTTGVPVPSSPYRKISELPDAQALTGNEFIPGDQNGTVKIRLSAVSGVLNGATVMTVTDESTNLPNSRRTVSGAGITFADGGPGSTFTIALSNAIVAGGPTGSANTVPVITYNAQGQLTAVTSATITPSSIGAVSSTTQIATGTGLSGGGDLTQNRTLFITPTIAAGGPTGSSSVVPVITYNGQGQLTAVGTATITPGAIGALRSASNLADVGSVVTSRQNLGLDYGPGLQAGSSGQVRPFIQVQVKTATFAAAESDRMSMFLSVSSASYTAALPDTATISGGWFSYFQNHGSGVLTVTSANAGVNVGGTPSMAMQPGDAVMFDYDSANTTFRAFWPAPFRNKQVFNANGSFVPSAGVYRVYVEGWGGGGSGGGGSVGSQGTGGGGGSYGADFFAVTPGVSVSVIVAAATTGGASGNNGTAGNLTSFSGTTLGNGGGAGQQTASASVAGGAAAAVADAIAGSASGTVGTTVMGSYGGASPKGGGAAPSATGAGGNGNNGVAPGGGGSGAIGANAGGNGAAGRVVVWF